MESDNRASATSSGPPRDSQASKAFQMAGNEQIQGSSNLKGK